MASGYDSNMFFENQLNNDNLTWELKAQPWIEAGKKVQDGPCSESILRGIITDTEFGVSGSHNFSAPDGGITGDLGNLVNKAAQAANQYSIDVAAGKGAINDIFGAGTFDKLASAIQDSASKLPLVGGPLSKAMGFINENAGSHFTTAFDYVRVFKGTNLEIDFPALETRLYHGTFVKNGSPMTTRDLMNDILLRFVGDLESSGSAALDQVLGIQNAPNDYVPTFKVIKPSVNNPLHGSFELRYGPYRIPNLLVSSFRYRVSTFKVREGANTGEFTPELTCKPTDQPLYLDINFTVQPCSYISRELLLQILTLQDWPPKASNN